MQDQDIIPAEVVVAQIQVRTPSYDDETEHIQTIKASIDADVCRRELEVFEEEEVVDIDEVVTMACSSPSDSREACQTTCQVSGRCSSVSTGAEEIDDNAPGTVESSWSGDLQDSDVEAAVLEMFDDVEIVEPAEQPDERIQRTFPAPEAPKKAPVFKETLNTTLADVWGVLANNYCVPQVRLIKEFHNGLALQASPWQEANERIISALARQMSYKMPLGGSSALASLVSLPEFSEVSSLCRLVRNPKEILLQEEITTAGVPLADSFRCFVTLSFEEQLHGGIVFQKWVEVQWVKQLSWSQRPLKMPLERRVAADAAASGRSLHQILKQEIANI